MRAVRGALAEGRAVLGGFRTVIRTEDGRRMKFMTAHQFIKTYYIAALLRPLAFLRSLPARPPATNAAAWHPRHLDRAAPCVGGKPLPAVCWQECCAEQATVACACRFTALKGTSERKTRRA